MVAFTARNFTLQAPKPRALLLLGSAAGFLVLRRHRRVRG